MTAFDLPIAWPQHAAGRPARGRVAADDRPLRRGDVAAADALGARAPVVLGCSMGGEICLELALRPRPLRGRRRVPGRRPRRGPPGRVGQARAGQREAVRARVGRRPDGPDRPARTPRRGPLGLRPERPRRLLGRHRVLLARVGRARPGGRHRHRPLPGPHPGRRVRLLVHAGARPRDGRAHPRRAVHADARASATSRWPRTRRRSWATCARCSPTSSRSAAYLRTR